MSIGLLAESIKSPTDILRLRAIEGAACSNGYVTYMTGWGKHNVTRLAQNIQELLSRSVDGLILHYNSPIPQDALELLARAFEMLLRMMAQPGEPVVPVAFESKLVIRESTGALAPALV
jgi:DNA-binding LacI/PurR family transcriptional regulator